MLVITAPAVARLVRCAGVYGAGGGGVRDATGEADGDGNMTIENSYCSNCQKVTSWEEFENFWKCISCGKETIKRTYDELLLEVEELQQRWSELKKSDFLRNPINKKIAESFMSDLDHTHYHLSLINENNELDIFNE